MDTSAGTQGAQQKANFPNGVPCASDTIMSPWMSYVYQQQPCPTNFTGVTVTLTVLDSNNNTYTIGTATTDGTGKFSYVYTPQVPGKYTVTATFPGNNGYWASSSEDSFSVLSAPQSTTAPTATPTSVADTYFVPGLIGLFVVIIIIGVVLALLMLRKRP